MLTMKPATTMIIALLLIFCNGLSPNKNDGMWHASNRLGLALRGAGLFKVSNNRSSLIGKVSLGQPFNPRSPSRVVRFPSETRGRPSHKFQTGALSIFGPVFEGLGVRLDWRISTHFQRRTDKELTVQPAELRRDDFDHLGCGSVFESSVYESQSTFFDKAM
jgi:hypothetical protein